MSDFWNEVKIHIFDKSFNQLDLTKLDYYYKAIYGKGLNKKCSQCYKDAHTMVIRYYRAKATFESDELTALDIPYLKKLIVKYNSENKSDYVAWIKNKIKELK
jgi:hypothetical protein